MDALKTLINSETEVVTCSDGIIDIPTFFLKLTDYYNGMKSWEWKDVHLSVEYTVTEVESFKRCLEHYFYSPGNALITGNCDWLRVADFLGLDLLMIQRIIDCLCGSDYTDLDFVISFILDRPYPSVKPYVLEKIYQKPDHFYALLTKIFDSNLQDEVIKCENIEFLIPGYSNCYYEFLSRIVPYQNFLQGHQFEGKHFALNKGKITSFYPITFKNPVRGFNSAIYRHQHRNYKLSVAKFTKIQPFSEIIELICDSAIDNVQFFNGIKTISPLSIHKRGNKIKYEFDQQITAIAIEGHFPYGW